MREGRGSSEFTRAVVFRLAGGVDRVWVLLGDVVGGAGVDATFQCRVVPCVCEVDCFWGHGWGTEGFSSGVWLASGKIEGWGVGTREAERAWVAGVVGGRGCGGRARLWRKRQLEVLVVGGISVGRTRGLWSNGICCCARVNSV